MKDLKYKQGERKKMLEAKIPLCFKAKYYPKGRHCNGCIKVFRK